MSAPERAAYEADKLVVAVVPWEEASPETKDDYRAIAQAAIKASPELTEAREQLAAVREIASGAANGPAAARLARRVLAVLDSKPETTG